MGENGQKSSPVVVVIEDHDIARNMVVELLEGYKVFPFENGVRALDWLKAGSCGKIDLVISDFDMPGPNGVEVLEEMKRSIPGVKTVLMSATVLDDLEQIAKKHNFSGWLIKPFNSAQIDEMLEKVFSGKKA
ncbi:MAG: response regulator [Verrucomicrobiae bacterium]|nr:response regulator [Verrucomicrobiae bacterium]